MNKKALSVLLCLAMLLTMLSIPALAVDTEPEAAAVGERSAVENAGSEGLPGEAAAPDGAGDGAASEGTNGAVSEDAGDALPPTNAAQASLMEVTYGISTAEDLNAVRNDLAGTYNLMNDIDLSSFGEWIPIGYGTGTDESFSGIFNGQGHKITGLTISNDEYDYYGLFGVVTGTVTNVGVDVAITTTKDNVGALAGMLYNGTVLNCSSTGSVEGNVNVGGLVGVVQTYNSGIAKPTSYAYMENCYSRASVTGVKAGTSDNLGGLIGKLYNYFYRSGYSQENSIGSVVKRCYATGYVRPKNDDAASGGLIGLRTKNDYAKLYPSVLFCYYDRTTTRAGDTDRSFSATTAQMKTQSIFTGWDFENVWGLDAAINDGYPYLKNGTMAYSVEGMGTEDAPYLIDDEFDLISITEGKLGDSNSYYELANDIVLDAVFWTPIGGNLSGRDFEGVFDGAGHTISNVNITQDNFANSGLFGVVTGTVKNLGVSANIAVTKNNVGALVGNLYNGTLINCYSVGSVEGNENVGGLAGVVQMYNSGIQSPTNHSYVENCYSRASVTGVKTGTSDNLGGLIGKLHNYYYRSGYSQENSTGSIVKRCYATGYVNPKNDDAASGGLIGLRTKNDYAKLYPSVLFCYYDRNTTRAGDTNKSFSATTAQMKTQSIFTGWDFENVWGIDAAKNDGYPYLKFGEYEYENEGAGSKYDPYMVYSTEDLIAITEGRIGKEGSCYELANDIVLDAVFWTPIGGNLSGRNFEGVFDGAGHTISGVNITQNNFANSGLFGVVTGTVKNLGVSANIAVTENNVGALAGMLYNGTIINCFSVGSVEGNENVGGLVGVVQTYNSGIQAPTAYATVENCYSRANVSGIEAGTSNNLGGLIGKLYNYFYRSGYSQENSTGSIVKRCYATGYVNPKNDSTAFGGLIGLRTKNDYARLNPSVLFCYYDRNATGAGDTNKSFSATTAQMKTQSIFTGWDFENVWGLDAAKNDGYPYLLFGEYEYENEGSGSKYDPYMVYSTEDLIAITEGRIGKEGSCYELANDIVLDAVFWTPIGGNLSGRSFEGIFDGAGHTISGVNITQDNFTYSGLFGVVTGTVMNLGVSANIAVTKDNVGALAGALENGTISSCYSVGSVSGKENVGGLVGLVQTYNSGIQAPTAYATVENCYSRASVSGIEAGTSNSLGGLIGKLYNYYYRSGYSQTNGVGSVVRSSYATGSIQALNNSASYGGVIGLVSKNQYSDTLPEVTACYYDQSTSGMSDTGKGIPLTAEDAKLLESYAGFDFVDVWAIASYNDGYPYLQAVAPGAVSAVTGVSLNKSVTTIELGMTETLVPTIQPSDATVKTVSWTSSDESVATVSDGMVTAVGTGTAIITVTTLDGGFTATCAVTVTDKTPATIPVTGVSLDKNTLSLEEGETAALTATVSPADATNKNVTWMSSDESVAAVTDGTVTAVGAGTAVITVTTLDGGFTATCAVTVTEKTPATVPVTGVSLDKNTLSLEEGETAALTATVSPADATNKNVTWMSSDESVAAVTDGTVTAVGAGTAVITATTLDGGFTATCAVTVTEKAPATVPVTGVSLNKTSLTLTTGGSAALTATVIPNNATNKNVTWTSDKPGVAAVSADGTVTAVSVGSAVVTVTTEDGGFSAVCTVTVTEPEPDIIAVSGVSLDDTAIELFVGESQNLTATVSPADATNKNVTWRASDETIVTVSKGTVTAQGAGTAVVTVITEDGGKTAECTVTVKEKPAVLSKLEVSGDEALETIQGMPVDLSGLVVTAVYSSGERSVVTDFTVSGFDPDMLGTQTITVSYGGLTADVSITVTPRSVTGISIAAFPSRLSYFRGDALNTAGLKVRVQYNNGTEKLLESGFTVSGYDPEILGSQSVLVQYEGFAAAFTVTVSEKPTVGDVSKPVIRIESVENGKRIILTCATDGAEIYYTTDGSTPTAESRLYEGPFTVRRVTNTIKAVAILGSESSKVTAGVINVSQVGGVDPNPGGGTVAAGTIVTLRTDTVGAEIYYTDGDGAFSRDTWIKYNGAIVIDRSKDIRAIAVKDGFANSAVTRLSYVVPVVEKPKDSVSVTLGSVTVAAGDVASIPVYLFTDAEDTAIYDFHLSFAFDKDFFENYVTLTPGEGIPDASQLYTSVNGGVVNILYQGAALSGGQEICTLNFGTLASMAAGTTLDIEVNLGASSVRTDAEGGSSLTSVNAVITLTEARVTQLSGTVTYTTESGKTAEKVTDIAEADQVEVSATFDDSEISSMRETTANVYLAIYDRDGRMVSVDTWKVDLSDPAFMFIRTITIPEDVEVGAIKIMVLSDAMVPLMAAAELAK